MKRNLEDKLFVVYIHRNLINGKVYVGQTCNLTERWRGQGKNYFNSTKFFNAIKKYGWGNFSHEVLYDNLNKEAADIIEKELIEKYNSIENGYNLKEGGARGGLSSESLQKMSTSLKEGYAEHPERKDKIRQKAIGRPVSRASKVKMSLNNPKSKLITINQETGSLRYWSIKLGTSHSALSYRLKKFGQEDVILYIKKKLATRC